jgi:hypothetical protein
MGPTKRKRAASVAPTRRPDDAWSLLLGKAVNLSPGLGSTIHRLLEFQVPMHFLWVVITVALGSCDCNTFGTLDVLETFAGEHRVTKAFAAGGCRVCRQRSNRSIVARLLTPVCFAQGVSNLRAGSFWFEGATRGLQKQT